MAATHSARSMSLASFRAGHAVRVDAERAERGGREPATRNPGQANPRDAAARPNFRAPAHGEPLTLSGAAGTAPHVRVTQWPYPGTEQVLRL